MKYPFEIKRVPAFLGTKDITHLYQDQYEHIVKPSMEVAKKALNGKVDPRMATMLCPPGSGKTTVFNIDLIWRIAALAVIKKSTNNLIILTAPDLTIIEDNLNLLNEFWENNEILDYLLNKHGIDWRGLYENPSDVRGRGLEILVCSIQKATGDQLPHLKKHSILMLENDEIHNGLGCPEGGEANNYENDIGHDGSTYEAKWFTAINELQPKMWFGLTGSDTDSIRNNDKYYYNISNKMEKSEWRLPFFKNKLKQVCEYSNTELVEEYFVALSKRNAISKHLHSKIPAKYLKTPSLSKLNDLKTSGMIKCGLSSSAYMEPKQVVNFIYTLNEKYKDETFMHEGEELSYHIGSPAILTTSGGIDQKTGGSNGECIRLLNSEGSQYNGVSVIYIGTVGINITNLGVIAILPVIDNKGNVDNSIYQLFCRMDRNKYGLWRGEFDYEVSQISDPKIRNLIIKLAVNLATKEAIVSYGGMAENAYNKTKENHVLAEDAYGYLHGLVSLKKQITTTEEQDEIYKLYKVENPHCEFCPQNEEGIPMCEVAARQNHLEDSDEDFAKWWFGDLEVDHKDGDHFNNDPENLQTLCSDEHGYKTQKLEEYRNRYNNKKRIK